MTEMSGFVQIKSFFRLDTDLKKRRYVGSVAARVLLILFLGFNYQKQWDLKQLPY